MHRRTDLHRFLSEQFEAETEREYPIPDDRCLHPIPDDGCLYSPGVTVLRGSEANGYPFLAAPFQIHVISCAAVNTPQLCAGEYAVAGERARMKAKVEAIIKTAVMANCQVVVLGAFGCGAYKNPPKVVAELFRDALASAEAVALSEVVFCILDDHNANQAHNPHGNLAPFKEVFGVGPEASA